MIPTFLQRLVNLPQLRWFRMSPYSRGKCSRPTHQWRHAKVSPCLVLHAYCVDCRGPCRVHGLEKRDEVDERLAGRLTLTTQLDEVRSVCFISPHHVRLRRVSSRECFQGKTGDMGLTLCCATLCLSSIIRRFTLSLRRLSLGMLIGVISGLERLGFPRLPPASGGGWP